MPHEIGSVTCTGRLAVTVTYPPAHVRQLRGRWSSDMADRDRAGMAAVDLPRQRELAHAVRRPAAVALTDPAARADSRAVARLEIAARDPPFDVRRTRHGDNEVIAHRRSQPSPG